MSGLTVPSQKIATLECYYDFAEEKKECHSRPWRSKCTFGLRGIRKALSMRPDDIRPVARIDLAGVAALITVNAAGPVSNQLQQLPALRHGKVDPLRATHNRQKDSDFRRANLSL